MKVWQRWAVPVMVLVDEDADELERVLVMPGARFADRDKRGHFLFYDERFERISVDAQPAAHALSVADYERWPDYEDWQREDDVESLQDWAESERSEHERPACPDCRGEGYRWADEEVDEGEPCPRCATNGYIERALGRHPAASATDPEGRPWAER